jgi:hypothetical protein
MSHRDNLIAVYAQTPVDEIEGSAAYQQLCAQYGADSLFQAEREKIESYKAQVEWSLLPGQTQVEQARAALGLLLAVRRDEDRDYYYRLIEAGYAPRWTAAQQGYLPKAWALLQTKYDFFLSFTMRFPPVPGENPVNGAYKFLILAELGPDEYNNADRKRRNLLAETMYRLLLRDAPVTTGFFFPHQQYDNTNTIQKLTEAGRESLVFVQLFQNIMFTNPQPRQNFCFMEYREALRNFARMPDRLVFAVAENALLAQNIVHPTYRQWHSHLAQIDPPYLMQIPVPNDRQVEDFRQLVASQVWEKIRATLMGIVDGVPAN